MINTTLPWSPGLIVMQYFNQNSLHEYMSSDYHLYNLSVCLALPL